MDVVGISIVVPCYNRAHTIFDTISSIQRNINTPHEVLIIDDASTDGTAEILRSYSFDDNVRVFFNTSNKGQNAARNFGILNSKFDIVTILDSDDCAISAPYDEIVNLFSSKDDVVCIFTYCKSMSSGRILSVVHDNIVEIKKSGFVDGTYRGEYQAFLRKTLLPPFIFRENLGVKRSCTILSWLELNRNGNVFVLPIVTKLYRDFGEDRLGNLRNIFVDARELEVCYRLIYDEYSDFYKSVGFKYYADLVSTLSYYRLLAYGRLKAINVLRDYVFFKGSPFLYLRHILFLILGASLVKYLRVIFGYR